MVQLEIVTISLKTIKMFSDLELIPQTDIK